MQSAGWVSLGGRRSGLVRSRCAVIARGRPCRRVAAVVPWRPLHSSPDGSVVTDLALSRGIGHQQHTKAVIGHQVGRTETQVRNDAEATLGVPASIWVCGLSVVWSDQALLEFATR